MGSYIETELKLRLLEPERWSQLTEAELMLSAGKAGPVKKEYLESQYYDTSMRHLQEAKMAYRIRAEEGHWTATVKSGGSSAGGLHRREEYTAALPEREPSIDVFLATPVGKKLKGTIGNQALEVIFTTRFTRYKRDIILQDGSCIEMAVDIGEIAAEGQSEPIHEVELELKDGHSSAVLALGAELAETFPLRVEPRSKYFRGLQLAGYHNETNNSSEANERPFHNNEPAYPAILQFITGILTEVLTAEEKFLQNRQTAEMLHQLRIQLRRLRTALSFAKPLLDDKEYERYQAELSQIGTGSGYLRQLDVVSESWQRIIASGLISVNGQFWIADILADERASALASFADPLSQGKSTPLYLGLWAELMTKIEDAVSKSEREDETLQYFVTRRICDWLGDLVTAGEEFDLNKPVLLHGLRIKGKKLRYMLEAFPEQVGNADKLVGRLKILQDGLGLLRDIQAATLLLNQWLQTRSSRALHRDAGLMMGWQAHELLNKQAELWDDWQRFNKTTRKWLKRHSSPNK